MFCRSLLLSVVSVASVVAACGGGDAPSRTPAGGLATCRADTDCVVTDRKGCGRCCASDPVALPKEEIERQQHLCEISDFPACAPNIECPKVAPTSQFIAKCKEGTCAAVKAN
jgi:hypothetical protein